MNCSSGCGEKSSGLGYDVKGEENLEDGKLKVIALVSAGDIEGLNKFNNYGTGRFGV